MNTSSTNVAAEPESTKFAATIVPEGYRTGFLPRHFGEHMLEVEQAVYFHMGTLTTEYWGSSWEFIDLSNGGSFMYPTTSTLHIVAPNGFDATVSGEVAGIIATLYALSHWL